MPPVYVKFCLDGENDSIAGKLTFEIFALSYKLYNIPHKNKNGGKVYAGEENR